MLVHCAYLIQELQNLLQRILTQHGQSRPILPADQSFQCGSQIGGVIRICAVLPEFAPSVPNLAAKTDVLRLFSDEIPIRTHFLGQHGHQHDQPLTQNNDLFTVLLSVSLQIRFDFAADPLVERANLAVGQRFHIASLKVPAIVPEGSRTIFLNPVHRLLVFLFGNTAHAVCHLLELLNSFKVVL